LLVAYIIFLKFWYTYIIFFYTLCYRVNLTKFSLVSFHFPGLPFLFFILNYKILLYTNKAHSISIFCYSLNELETQIITHEFSTCDETLVIIYPFNSSRKKQCFENHIGWFSLPPMNRYWWTRRLNCFVYIFSSFLVLLKLFSI